MAGLFSPQRFGIFATATPGKGVGMPKSPANTRNWTAARFTKVVSGLARVRGGTGRMRVASAGDSTTSGINATRATSGPAALAARLAALWGVPVSTNSIFGAGSVGTTAVAVNAHDSRITSAGSPTASANTYGGPSLRLAATGQSWTLSFGQCDTLELYWMMGAGHGAFNLYIDGSLYGSNPINCSIASGYTYHKTTVTGLSDAPHTVTAEWSSGTTYVVGGIGTRSTVPAVDVLNGGAPSTKTTDWTVSSGNSMGDLWKLLAADVNIITLGINDENAQAMLPASFTTNLSALVDTSKTTLGSDTIVVVPNWINNGTSLTTMQATEAAILAASDSKSVPAYDFRSLYPSWQAMQNAGLMGGNTVHPTAAGYSALWTALANAIVAVAP